MVMLQSCQIFFFFFFFFLRLLLFLISVCIFLTRVILLNRVSTSAYKTVSNHSLNHIFYIYMKEQN